MYKRQEFYHQNHTPISAHNEKEHQKTSPYRFAYFVLTDEREKLYRRIDHRVDLMMEQGLLTEVKTLYDICLLYTSSKMLRYCRDTLKTRLMYGGAFFPENINC